MRKYLTAILACLLILTQTSFAGPITTLEPETMKPFIDFFGIQEEQPKPQPQMPPMGVIILSMHADVDKMAEDFKARERNTPPLLVGFCGVNRSSGTVIKYVPKAEKTPAYAYILTAKHVVTDDKGKVEKVTATFYAFNEDETIHSFVQGPAEVVYTDAKYDYAILKTEVPVAVRPVVTVHPLDTMRHELGSTIFSVGRPVGRPYWITHGHIAYKDPFNIGHDCGIWYGFSGGPVLSKQNVQIGVNVSIGYDNGRPIENVANSVPLNAIYQTLGPEKVELYFGHKLDKEAE